MHVELGKCPCLQLTSSRAQQPDPMVADGIWTCTWQYTESLSLAIWISQPNEQAHLDLPATLFRQGTAQTWQTQVTASGRTRLTEASTAMAASKPFKGSAGFPTSNTLGARAVPAGCACIPSCTVVAKAATLTSGPPGIGWDDVMARGIGE